MARRPQALSQWPTRHCESEVTQGTGTVTAAHWPRVAAGDLRSSATWQQCFLVEANLGSREIQIEVDLALRAAARLTDTVSQASDTDHRAKSSLGSDELH